MSPATDQPIRAPSDMGTEPCRFDKITGGPYTGSVEDQAWSAFEVNPRRGRT
ncbi:hypothetical protein Acsp05_02710 [Actinokineospora sp. NBRC 105648]|nr:hypothetical protein Acsp05_02710 [Actinokineospora sp. NBRC 105648]